MKVFDDISMVFIWTDALYCVQLTNSWSVYCAMLKRGWGLYCRRTNVWGHLWTVASLVHFNCGSHWWKYT